LGIIVFANGPSCTIPTISPVRDRSARARHAGERFSEINDEDRAEQRCDAEDVKEIDDRIRPEAGLAREMSDRGLLRAAQVRCGPFGKTVHG
jgi:hypothetical protein